MADWDVVGTAPAQVQNPWAVKGNTPAPSEHGIAAPGTPLARVSGTQEALLGPTELLGSTVGNIPHAAAHAAVDLYRRLTGGNLEAPEPAVVSALHVPVGKARSEEH